MEFERGWLWTLAAIAILTANFIYIYPKYLRQYVLDYIRNKFINEFHPFLNESKTEAFAEAYSKLEKTSQPLKVLEIGPGSGCNFQYYPKNAKVTLLDKTDDFSAGLKASIKNMNRDDLTIENKVICKAENMHSIESNSFDMVIATFLICSVDNSQAVYDEIYRVLKNGGVYVFFDHSKDMDHPIRNLAHILVQPLWTLTFGDCKFIDVKSKLKKQTKFQILQMKTHKYYPGKNIFQFTNPVIYGFGQKLE